MPATDFNFEGVNNVNGVLPPDTNGDIGYDPATGKKYYFQWVNLSYAIWDVTTNPPTLVLGPVNGNTMWSGFGGICETHNDGDPIVLYDPLANRWMISQFALDFGTPDFHQCIAVSETGDPTGAWYRYDFQISTTKMNDYPHFGVWPDGYYMSINQFDAATFGWAGGGAIVFEREKMLQGQSAQMVYFDLSSVSMDYGGMLPSDLDGASPPAGAPNYFAEWDDGTWFGGYDALRIWEFHVDWDTPANSTFGVSGDPNYIIPTADIDPDMCGFARNCIPQPGGTALDAIADRIMYRLQYRNFGDHQTLVGNHTVDADGTDHAGVYWFELRNIGTGWDMYQEGVYAPDSDNRWMGSIAMDQSGNIALGYSVSSSSTYPSIRYDGRLDGDPLGQMTQGEAEIIAGGGSQSHSAGRWGDYSMMGVDPTDGCTFWYTQEYIETDGNAPWQTRIGSFRFPTCGANIAQGTLTGVVDDGSNPVEGITVRAVSGSTDLATATDASGVYTLTLPIGTYDVSAFGYGYQTASVSGVAIVTDTTTTQNFTLVPATMYTLDGTVTDAYLVSSEVLTASFESGVPAGWSAMDNEGNGVEWEACSAWGANYTGGAGDCIGVSSDAAGQAEFDAELHSPVIDLSNAVAAEVTYKANYQNYAAHDFFDVDVSTDGGSTWETVSTWNEDHGAFFSTPGEEVTLDLSDYAGEQIIIRWRYYDPGTGDYDWYAQIDDVVVSVDEPAVRWPLYAHVSVSSDAPGFTGMETWTDPETGQYSFSLAEGYTYTLDVEAFSDGYLPASVDVPDLSADTTQDIFLLADMDACAAPGYTFDGFWEDFETGVPPAGWTVVDNAGGLVWMTNTDYGDGNYTGGDGLAADVNSDANYGVPYDTELRTPPIDMTAMPVTDLSYLFNFQSYSGQEALDVDISTDGGTTWTNLRHWTTDQGSLYGLPGVKDTIDLSAYAAETNVILRWRYYTPDTSPWDWYAQVDNVGIGICVPQDGGLVVGNVYAAATSQPLNDATVESDSGFMAASVPTPDDGAVDDGFYTAFAPAGSHVFTATMTYYGPDVETVTAVENDVVVQDFYLDSGEISAAPNGLDITLPMGVSGTLTMTVENTGAYTAYYTLREKDTGFTPMSPVIAITVPPSHRAATADGTIANLHPFFRVPIGTTYYDPNPLLLSTTDVLLLDADDGAGEPMKTILGSYPDIGVVDEWLVNAAGSIPTLNDLLPYDVVIVWSDYDYLDSVALGNVLADYVDAGGKVIVATFSWYDNAAASLTGRFASGGYDPFISDNVGNHFTYASLGAYDAGHPIMAGVTSAADAYRDYVSLAPDATLVASWDDGEEFIAVKGNVVAINSYPGFYYAWSGDVGMIFHNAINYLAFPDVPWLSETPPNGTLAPAAGDVISVTFDASVPEVDQPGEYHAIISVDNNTPYDAPMVPVTMTVTAPASWGKLEGTVTDQAQCHAGPTPVEGAEVLIEASTGTWMTTTVQTTLFSEDFEVWPLNGWTIVDNAGTGNIWDRNDAFGASNETPGSGYSADADSDGACNWSGWDTEMWSPAIDLSGYTTVTLSFASNFQDFAGAGEAWVDVSTDGGSTWTNIFYATEDEPSGGIVHNLDLTAYAGQTIVLRWRYSDNDDGCAWYWQVDDVSIVGVSQVFTFVPDSWTTTTDENGYYSYWLDESHSPLTVTVSIPGYTDAEASGVTVISGTTTTQDFDVWKLEPCVTATSSPDPLHITLDIGISTTVPLTLSNGGGISTTFELMEQNGGFAIAMPEAATPIESTVPESLNVNGEFQLAASAKGAGEQNTPQPMPTAPNEVFLTHSASQTIMSANSVSCNAGGLHADNSYLRTFTLSDFGIFGDLTVTSVDVGVELASAGSGGSQPATVNLYTLDGPLVWANMTLIGTADVDVADQSLSIINVPVNGTVPAGGTLVVEFFTPDGQADGNSFFVGSNNLGQTAPTYLAAADCGVVEPTDTAALGFPDMHLVMNVRGETAGGDIPWLSENVITGTINQMGGMMPISVTFDASVPEITQPGDYTGTLMVASDDPAAPLAIPVTMTVNAPATWGKLEGTVTGMGYCDANPMPLEGAEILIEASGGYTKVVTTDANGYFGVWFDSSNSPVKLTVMADGYELGSAAGVVMSAGNTTTQDFSLRWLQPCVSTTPEYFDVTMGLTQTLTQTLTIFNNGAVGTDFTIGTVSEPWLDVMPLAGTIAADSQYAVDVIFDTSVFTQTGNYTATLMLTTDDPITPTLDVPVYLHVTIYDIYLPLIMKTP